MLRARQVFNDADRARSLLTEADDEQKRRIFWLASIVLARASLHALVKVDATADVSLRTRINEQWNILNSSKPKPDIFWGFLELERNLVLKQFEFAPDLENGFLMLEDGSGALLLENGARIALEGFFSIKSDGPFKGKDGRKVLDEALAWVDEYISRFEKSTGDCNEGATATGTI
jgi:hypothetical protein